MKAQEVLKRYAAGERNFRNVNLRGQNFKSCDLSGTDFSYSDIRGTNFTNAILRTANFTGVKAGLQKQWISIQIITVFLLSTILTIAVILINRIFIPNVFDLRNIKPEYSILPIIIITIVFEFSLLAIIFIGLNIHAIGTISIVIIVGISLAIIATISANTLTNSEPISITFAIIAATAMAFGLGLAMAITISISIAVAVSFACTITAGGILPIIGLIGFISGLIIAIKGQINFSFGISIDGQFISLIGGSIVSSSVDIVHIFCIGINILLVTFYIAHFTLKRDRRFELVHNLKLAFSSTGGTSFYGANLTNTNFTKAQLQNSDFRRAVLIGTCFRKVRDLDCVRAYGNYLMYPNVADLILEENRQNQNFDHYPLCGIDLRGMNLFKSSFQRADLSYSILKNTNLSDANLSLSNLNHSNLRDVNLSRAILKQTQLDGADLTGAVLTGAYIEDWGITGTTRLDNIRCDYIYMRVPTKENPNPLRKPDNLHEVFADEEFSDFIKPYIDTLDLYHSQNVDPRAISIAFKKLSISHPEANLSIVAVEKRGQNSFNLKVRTSPTVDKSELNAEYFEDYNWLKMLPPETQMLFAEKDDRIRSLEQMIQTALKQPTFNIQGDFMPENSGISIDAGETIGNISGLVGGSISGDVHGVINLGDISGNVTNTINQLPNETSLAQANLKELLTQLKQVIETTTELSIGEKTLLLEQVKVLAEAKQTPELADRKNLVQKAQGIFEAILKSLPDTAKVVEACSNLLPTILQVLGMTL